MTVKDRIKKAKQEFAEKFLRGKFSSWTFSINEGFKEFHVSSDDMWDFIEKKLNEVATVPHYDPEKENLFKVATDTEVMCVFHRDGFVKKLKFPFRTVYNARRGMTIALPMWTPSGWTVTEEGSQYAQTIGSLNFRYDKFDSDTLEHHFVLIK